MVQFGPFWQSFVFAMSLTMSMIILAVFGGPMIDDLVVQSATWPGSTSVYVTASQPLLNMYMNMFYGVCCAISIFGWLVFLQSVRNKDSSSMYYDRSFGRFN